jgi:hypothetical protein
VKKSGGEPVYEDGGDDGEERVGETGDEAISLGMIKRVRMEYGMVMKKSSVDRGGGLG